MVGLIAFGDPPRPDSRALLVELRSLGVRTVMVTGDAAATAATVARSIGLEGAVCPAGKIPESVGPDDFAVYAGVFPEDKFRLVKAFQQRGHSVGMCGDGANDAPALRQAQMGIAVSTATDVAKAAAGIVLTSPGLGEIVVAIKEGRSGFQRIMTYTLSLLVNKSVTLVVMLAGLIMTGHAVLTPILQALSMLAGDLVTMSRAADRARPSPYPNAWRIGNMTLAAIPLGIFKLGYCVGVLATGWFVLGFSPGQMRTLTFLMLVLAGQASVYVLRERTYLWRSRPAPLMLFASLADVTIVTWLALSGVLMPRSCRRSSRCCSGRRWPSPSRSMPSSGSSWRACGSTDHGRADQRNARLGSSCRRLLCRPVVRTNRRSPAAFLDMDQRGAR